MAKMERDGIEEEELLAIAEKIGFKIESDEDLIRLFREADKLGFWPELHRPKLDTTGKNIVPHPQDPTRRYIAKWENMIVPDGHSLIMTKKGPQVLPPTKKELKEREKREKAALLRELEAITKKTASLLKEEADEDFDEWLDKL